MTVQAKLVIALAASAVLTAWAAHEFLAAALDPVIRSLGS